MTDQEIDTGSTDQQDTNFVQDQQVSAPAPAQNAVNNDGISKERVSEIVRERTREAAQKAYERGKSEAASQQTGNLGGMHQMSEDTLRQMMRDEYEKRESVRVEEYKRHEYQQQVQNLANDYMGKIVAAKDLYPDLEKRREEIGEFADLIPFINDTDEAAGITQHLLDNGHNVASLMVLSKMSPNLLKREMSKLAASIKTNDDARRRPEIDGPLSHITPSNNAMDSGSSSIETLKKQDWLRG